MFGIKMVYEYTGAVEWLTCNGGSARRTYNESMQAELVAERLRREARYRSVEVIRV